MPVTNPETLIDPQRDAKLIRALELKAVEHRRFLLNLGRDHKIRLHYGATMSMVEILNILYFHWLNYDPDNPGWSGRDRFVLSKGHAAPSLYITLSMAGFFPQSEFQNFRRLGSILQGHPDRNKTPGVDCSSGSLGQGFPVACGMALGAKMDHAPFKVYSVISDGECNEGSVWEAALIAANLRLDNLVVMLDRNMKSSYGPMAGRNDVEPLAEKWQAFGWEVVECDGHDYTSLSQALCRADNPQGRPYLLICHTVKGKGIPHAETHPTRSNFSLTEEQHQEAMVYLDSLEMRLINDPAR